VCVVRAIRSSPRPGWRRTPRLSSAGQARVGTMAGRAPGRLAGGRCVEHLPGCHASAHTLLVGQAKPRHRPLAGAHRSIILPPSPTRMRRAVNRPRPHPNANRRTVTATCAARHRGLASRRTSSRSLGVQSASTQRPPSSSGPAFFTAVCIRLCASSLGQVPCPHP